MIVEVQRHVAGPLKGQLAPPTGLLGVDATASSVITQITSEFNLLTKGKDEKALGKRIKNYKVGIFLALTGTFIAIAKLLHNQTGPFAPEARSKEPIAANLIYSNPAAKYATKELDKITDTMNRRRWEISTEKFYKLTNKPILSKDEINLAVSNNSLRQAVMSSPHYSTFVVIQKQAMTRIDIIKLLAEAEAKIFNDQNGGLLLESLQRSDFEVPNSSVIGHRSESQEAASALKQTVTSPKFKNTLRVVLVIASLMLVYFLKQVQIKAQRIAFLEAKEFLKEVSRERLSAFGIVAVTTPKLDRLIFTHNNKRAAIQMQHQLESFRSAPIRGYAVQLSAPLAEPEQVALNRDHVYSAVYMQHPIPYQQYQNPGQPMVYGVTPLRQMSPMYYPGHVHPSYRPGTTIQQPGAFEYPLQTFSP